MIEGRPLSVEEAFVLLDPQHLRGRDAVKLAMTGLLARRAVRVETEERPGILRTRKTVSLLLGPAASGPLPVGGRSLCGLIGASGTGCTMDAFVKAAQREYGSQLQDFVRSLVRPELMRRGLVFEKPGRVLWVLPRRLYLPTPAGDAERQRIEAAMVQARTLPDFLQRDPTGAAALAATLGVAILLVPELRAHYQALSLALRPPPEGGDVDTGDGDFSTGSDTGTDAGDLSSISDFGDLDFGAFDALDAGFDAFDSGFDASDSGGDGGGDGGGGC